MTKFLKITAAVALVSVAAASFASAGLNSAATAQMYWQTGSTGAAIAARDNVAAQCQLVVTAKGLTNFAGCDVQLLINALDGGAVPASWQGQQGGCAEGFITGYPGGRGGTIFRNAFTTAPAVPGPLASQNGEFYNTGDCKTPHGVALLWLSDAGGAGVARTNTLEYALWAVNFDLLNSVDPVDGVTPCDDGRGVCINPNLRLPCSDSQRGAVVETLDGNFNVDFPAFVAGKTFLTHGAGAAGGSCPGVTSSKTSTWGTLKKLYK
jgi:hypothetical protein